jgi:hypothetical protein
LPGTFFGIELEFAINHKIAKSLDLSIPAGVLVQADAAID